MNPPANSLAKGLVDATAALLARVLRFEQATDQVIETFWREEHRRFGFGPRERHAVGEAVWRVVRHKNAYEAGAQALIQADAAHSPARAGDPSPDPQRVRLRRIAQLALQAAPDPATDPAAPAAVPSSAQARAAPGGQASAASGSGAQHHLPDWLAQAMRQQLGDDEFWAWARAQDNAAPLDLRANVAQIKRDALVVELRGAGIDCTPATWSPWGVRLGAKRALGAVDAYRRGACEVQDEGSQLLALLVDARRGDMVADFCAGAGGKSLALAAAMRDTGRVYAFDTSAHRLAALQPRLARAGFKNVHASAIAHEDDERLQRWVGKFDRVLVDAPCSGLGTLRRQPDLKWRQSPATVTAMAQRQAAILRAAARLLKPGGRLVYATCSPLSEENEAVASAFSKEFAIGFDEVSAVDVLRKHLGDAAAGLCSRVHGMGDTPEATAALPPAGRFMRLWTHRHGTDGFFAAIWQRRT